MKTKSSSTAPSAPTRALGFSCGAAALVMLPDNNDRTVERLQRWVTGVNSFLGHVQAFLVHAFVPALKLSVLTAIVFVLAKVAAPHLRRRLRSVKWAALRIVPGAESRYDPTAWLRFYRALYGMAAPAWKRPFAREARGPFAKHLICRRESLFGFESADFSAGTVL